MAEASEIPGGSPLALDHTEKLVGMLTPDPTCVGPARTSPRTEAVVRILGTLSHQGRRIFRTIDRVVPRCGSLIAVAGCIVVAGVLVVAGTVSCSHRVSLLLCDRGKKSRSASMLSWNPSYKCEYSPSGGFDHCVSTSHCDSGLDGTHLTIVSRSSYLRRGENGLQMFVNGEYCTMRKCVSRKV